MKVDDVRVEVRHEAEGPRARWLGIMACGHIWDCPCCAPKLIAERCEDLSRLTEHVGKERVAMLTLTVRHARGDLELRELVRGIRRAWRRMKQGRAGQALFSDLECEVSRIEITHGETHSWHPHLHVLIVWKQGTTPQSQTSACSARSKKRGQTASHFFDDVRACARRGCARCSWKERVTTRWQDCVSKEIGETRRPLSAHAAVYTSDATDVAAYIAKVKLALEVAGVGKQSRDDGHRDVWEIAKDVGRLRERELSGQRMRVAALTPAEDRKLRRDVALWKEYAAATRGVRMFTWSARASSLLDAARIAAAKGSISSEIDGEERDDDVTIDCAEEIPESAPTEIALTDDEFELVSWVTRYKRGEVSAEILEAAERGGAFAVAVELAALWRERAAEPTERWWAMAIDANTRALDSPMLWTRDFMLRMTAARQVATAVAAPASQPEPS